MVEEQQSPPYQQQQEQQHPRINWPGLSLVIFTPALGGFLYGYDIGATSFVLAMLNGISNTNQNSHGQQHHHHHQQQHEEDLTEVGSLVWWNNFESRHVQAGLMISAVSLGALLASHLLFHFFGTNQVSRRMELRIAATLYTLGSLLNIASGTVLAHSSTAGWCSLLLGRLLFGMGVGFVMHGAPTYMAEMSPSTIRGAIVSAKETVIVGGIAVGYAVGDTFSTMNEQGAQLQATMYNYNRLNATTTTQTELYTVQSQQHYHYNWTDLYMVSLCMAIPMLFLTFLIPRSKRWLLMRGEYDEALASMRFIYTGDEEDIQNEFTSLSASMEANQIMYGKKQFSTFVSGDRNNNSNDNPGQALQTTISRLFSPPIRPALTTALGLVALQQCSGQPSVLSYATVLFRAAGWSGHVTVVMATLMMGVSTCTVVLVDRLGRRRHLLACISVLFASLVTLAICFWNWQNNDEDTSDDDDSSTDVFGHTAKIIILVAMCCYIGGYQIGFGPITWLLVSEMFPGDVRGPATALGVELNYLLNFTVQFSVPILQDRMGWGRTFGVFAMIMLAALGFVYYYVPETKGKTLEQIEQELLNHQHGDPSLPPTECTPLHPASSAAAAPTAPGGEEPRTRYVDQLRV